jgi:hypothetical protein
MAEPSAADVDPVVAMPWRISLQDRVGTAGSCFAQHVSRRLQGSGLQFLETEPAHPFLSAETAALFGYGLFSARYGTIYTARQLLQLLRRAYGRFIPEDDVWRSGGRIVDPFRPTIQPEGFPTQREFELDRIRHFAAVRRLFEEVDVFVFTLGLTECWRARTDGAVYPLCPGVAGGEFDPERHEFHNFSVDEVVSDLDAFLVELRSVNPRARLVLTVSPVPLAATAEPRHVWTSTTLSKAVLRLAAEEMRRRPGVAYFPAYEIVTAPSARGGNFEDDLRSVSKDAVDHVMRLFTRHFVDEHPSATAPHASVEDDFLDRATQAVNVLCDEARLDPDPR